MNICIVTGASSGMGREAVKQLDNIYTDGIDEIWLISRRSERLCKLSRELKHNVRILPLDLSVEKDLQEFDLTLSLSRPNVKILVNAAGYGVLGKFTDSECAEQTGMIRLNCEALTRITHCCLEYMSKGARIVNFASAAAFVPQAGFSVYAATKSYVLSFSRALNRELSKRKISVTAVCPGPVDTEFFKIAEKHCNSMKIKKIFIAKASKVVSQALADAYRRKSVSVYSVFMKGFWLLTKILPHELVLTLMSIFS